LSGGMEFKSNLDIEWREYLTTELEKLGHSAMDPTKIEQDENITGPVQLHLTKLRLEGKFDEVREIVRTNLIRKDMYAIQLSDATILLYDTSVQLGAGTISEGWESFREARPIYLVTEFPLNKLPTWLIGETTQMFSGFEDLLIYLKDHTQVRTDIVAAQKIRDEVLGGIYSTS